MSTPVAPNVGWDEVAGSRLARAGLDGGGESPVEVAANLVGVQAQDMSAAGLALSVRCPGTTETDLNDLLFDNRALVKLWGQRNTLHLYATADWPLVFGAFGEADTPFERSIRKRGVDLSAFRHALSRFVASISHEQSFGYDDLENAELGLDGLDVSGWSAGPGDLCLTIERRGSVCHAQPIGSTSRFAHHDQWLPGETWRPVPAEEAGGELARRYLSAYGPASEEDLAHWAGISRATASEWLNCLRDDVKEIEMEHGTLLTLGADPAAEVTLGEEHWARLLGKYDPILLAHADKDWLVDPVDKQRVWRSGGRVEAVVLADGRIEGTWRYKRRSRRLDLAVDAFDAPAPWLADTIETEAHRVADHFGLDVGEVAIRSGGDP